METRVPTTHAHSGGVAQARLGSISFWCAAAMLPLSLLPGLVLLPAAHGPHSTVLQLPPAAGWQPVLGDWSKPVLAADNSTWEVDAVQEPQVIWDPALKVMRMWYRGAGWGSPSGLGVADSTDGGKSELSPPRPWHPTPPRASSHH